MKLYLGIDPGVSGAWVVINQSCKIEKLGLWEDRRNLFESVCCTCGIQLAAIERVHSMPRQGVASTFTFGQNYGWWLGALDVIKIPYERVPPMRWQKSVLDVAVQKKTMPKPNETEAEAGKRQAANKKAIKENIVAFAKRRFPVILPEYLTVKKNWGLADAACLALYSRLMGDPSCPSNSIPEQWPKG